MSMESAMAVLEKAVVPMESKPGLDPDKAEIVKDTAKDAIKDINFNIKVDALKPTEPEKKEEPKAEPVKTEATAKPTEELKPADPEQEKMSQRFALIARKEKELVRAQQELKNQIAQWQEKLKPAETYESLKSKVRENPMLALKELGVSYDDLTKYITSGKMPEGAGFEIQQVREEITRIREDLKRRDDEIAKLREKRRQESERQTITDFFREIGDYVKSNAEKYELINQLEATNLVFDTINNHFEKEQQLLSIEAAAEMVEKYLEEQADKVFKAKKYASRLGSPMKEPMKPSPTAQPRTLTNEMTSSAPSILPAKTEQDRINRALAALAKHGA